MFESSDDMLQQPPRFMSPVLKAAAVYNVAWGLVVVLYPSLVFQLLGMALPNYPSIWQCVGMIVGVYGIGYWIAASDPFRHWAIVFVGLLGKVFGPIGFVGAAATGELPWTWGLMLLMNDLIWWGPFVAILYYAAKANSDRSVGRPHDVEDATNIFPSAGGKTLSELSADRPLMVLFLRHFGCTFCREALADLASVREEIESLGFNIALVHMSPWAEAEEVLKKQGLEGIHQFSDGNCEMYRAFGLERASAAQLFGFDVWRRGLMATLRGHLVGRLQGDSFRMPGLFFLHQSEIYGSYRHRTAADRPQYAELARQCHNAIDRETLAP